MIVLTCFGCSSSSNWGKSGMRYQSSSHTLWANRFSSQYWKNGGKRGITGRGARSFERDVSLSTLALEARREVSRLVEYELWTFGETLRVWTRWTRRPKGTVMLTKAVRRWPQQSICIMRTTTLMVRMAIEARNTVVLVSKNIEDITVPRCFESSCNTQ